MSLGTFLLLTIFLIVIPMIIGAKLGDALANKVFGKNK